jgi:hypothetical protein
MSVPKTLDFARADKTAIHTRTGEERGIALGDGKRVAEDLTGCRRRRK